MDPPKVYEDSSMILTVITKSTALSAQKIEMFRKNKSLKNKRGSRCPPYDALRLPYIDKPPKAACQSLCQRPACVFELFSAALAFKEDEKSAICRSASSLAIPYRS